MDTKPNKGLSRIFIYSYWSFFIFFILTVSILGILINYWSNHGISWKDVDLSDVFQMEITPSYNVNDLSPLEIEIVYFDVPITSDDVFEIIEAFSNEIIAEKEEETPELIIIPEIIPEPVTEETELVHEMEENNTNPTEMELESDNKNTPTYADLVYAKIINNRFYPDVSRKREQEGVVKVKFTILADGSLENVEIIEESEHRYLNQAALKTIEDSAPFPPPDDETESIRLVVDLTYELNPVSETNHPHYLEENDITEAYPSATVTEIEAE